VHALGRESRQFSRHIDCRLHNRRIAIRFPAGARDLLLWGPTQPGIRLVLGAHPGREADRTPASGAEIKYAWSCTVHKGSFTVTFTSVMKDGSPR